MAIWLDSFCYPLDHAILEAIHNFAVATGGALTPLIEAYTILADKGIGMILLGLLLACFRRTRKVGLCVLFAVACGALITNVTLKNIIARPRPFADRTRDFYEWWVWIGAHPESVNSFPSGHTTAATAAMTAIFLTTNRKYSWTALLFAVGMGFTRMYLMVHYPTDVLAGFVAGALGGVAALFILRTVWGYIERNPDKKVCRFLLHFDLAELFEKKNKNAQS